MVVKFKLLVRYVIISFTSLSIQNWLLSHSFIKGSSGLPTWNAMAVSTQVLALGTFAIHFTALPLALLPWPTLRSYSLNVYFVVAFCALSASLNIMWLKEIFTERDDNGCDPVNKEFISQDVLRPCQKIFDELAHVQERSIKSTYLPFYIVGNVLLCELYFVYNDAYCL